jgi:hypothetical protein
MPLFHSDSRNICRIANLSAGGEMVHKSAQFPYSPCHDTIRTQILNWTQRCGNCRFGTAARFQPGQKPTVLFAHRVTNQQRQSGLAFSAGLELKRSELWFKNRTAGGVPIPVANTSTNKNSFLPNISQYYIVNYT